MSYPHRPLIRLSALMIAAILILPFQGTAQAQTTTTIIWLHHSVGYGIIDGGGVREGLTALGYEFYDHGYNGDGLRLADGTWTGTNFDVPDDNTYPDGLATIFSQPLHNPPDNTFSYLMQYDVIMVKSCFPTSNIGDDAQLEADKDYYRTIASRADQYPAKLFIIVSHPPQVPGATNAAEAARARALNDWLLSDAYQSGHANLRVFDLFGRLAGSDNMLRSEYRSSNSDAHPNSTANAAVGPQLVTFIDVVIHGGTPHSSAPAHVEAIAPTKYVASHTPEFQWHASQGATSYRLLVKQGSAVVFDQSYTTAEAACADTCSVSSASVPAGPTLSDGRYSFTVTPSNDFASARVSRALAFVVDTTAPQPPVLASPISGAVVRALPYLTVRRPATAVSYRYALDDDADCATPFFTSDEQKSTRYKPVSLDLGSVTWCAQARDEAGNWSDWSVTSFVLAPPIPAAPGLVGPANSAKISGGLPAFTWKVVAGDSITYEIQIGSTSKFPLPLVDSGSASGLTWTPGTSLPAGTYYWRVRALNANAEPGKWSSVRKIIIIP